MLLAKTLWKIRSKKDFFWVKWMNQIFLHGKDIWDYTVRKDDSSLLKRILEIRDYITRPEQTVHTARDRLANWADSTKFSLWFFQIEKTEGSMGSNCLKSIMSKHAFVLWLGAKSKLLTKDILHHTNIYWNCVFCGYCSKIVQCLFFICLFIYSIWGHIREWLGIRLSMSMIQSTLKSF